MLGAGDKVFHPRHGFGAISGLSRHDPRHPVQDAASVDISSEEDYYDIQLLEGGTLLVPVSRADQVGLRPLTNGVETVMKRLHSPAQTLPQDARKRAAELQARGQNGEPTALADAVRDMVTHTRGRTLRDSEKLWLEKACACLVTEAALVDRIPKSEARASILAFVAQLSAK